MHHTTSTQIKGTAVAALLAASTLTIMAGAALSPALPVLQRAFAQTAQVDTLVRLALTLPALFVVLSAPALGWLGDQIGRKTVLVAALVVYGFAGGLGLVANSLEVILVGRALLGLAVAAILTSVTGLIADLMSGVTRTRLLSAQGVSIQLGGVVFLIVGGSLADLGWRWPFAVYLAAWAVLPLAFLSLPSSQAAARVQPEKGGLPWTRLMLPYAIVCAATLCSYLIPVHLPFVLQRLGAGGMLSGATIAVVTLASAMSAALFPALRSIFNQSALAGATFGMLGVGFAVLGFADSYAGMIVGVAVVGLGQGVLTPNLNAWLSDLVRADQRGQALGGLTSSLFLGQFLSPVISAPLAQLGVSTLFFATSGFAVVFSITVLLYSRLSSSTQKRSDHD